MVRNVLTVSAAALGVTLLCISALDWLGYDLFIWRLLVH
jgi:hypothetical protein